MGADCPRGVAPGCAGRVCRHLGALPKNARLRASQRLARYTDVPISPRRWGASIKLTCKRRRSHEIKSGRTDVDSLLIPLHARNTYWFGIKDELTTNLRLLS